MVYPAPRGDLLLGSVGRSSFVHGSSMWAQVAATSPLCPWEKIERNLYRFPYVVLLRVYEADPPLCTPLTPYNRSVLQNEISCSDTTLRCLSDREHGTQTDGCGSIEQKMREIGEKWLADKFR